LITRVATAGLYSALSGIYAYSQDESCAAE